MRPPRRSVRRARRSSQRARTSALGFSAIGWGSSGGTTPQIEPPSATLALLTQYVTLQDLFLQASDTDSRRTQIQASWQETWLTKPHA